MLFITFSCDVKQKQSRLRKWTSMGCDKVVTVLFMVKFCMFSIFLLVQIIAVTSSITSLPLFLMFSAKAEGMAEGYVWHISHALISASYGMQLRVFDSPFSSLSCFLIYLNFIVMQTSIPVSRLCFVIRVNVYAWYVLKLSDIQRYINI